MTKMAYYLHTRDVIDEVKSAPETFTSWDKCMSKTYCKYVGDIALFLPLPNAQIDGRSLSRSSWDLSSSFRSSGASLDVFAAVPNSALAAATAVPRVEAATGPPNTKMITPACRLRHTKDTNLHRVRWHGEIHILLNLLHSMIQAARRSMRIVCHRCPAGTRQPKEESRIQVNLHNKQSMETWRWAESTHSRKG